jgi:hypothetical protein
MRITVAAAVAFVSSAALAAPPLPAADEAAAFKAAGFARQGKIWRACDDPTPSYVPGAVAEVRDLNGDGLPEAVLTEGGSYCHGNTGVGYWLVSKQKTGGWKLMTNGTGMLAILASKGAGGWPDLEIGGPGFCFPVVRYDGTAYRLHRRQYDGKPCRN